MHFKEELLLLLKNINRLQENERLEFKESVSSIPKDFWPTYSSFANTRGGIILLGVKDNPTKIIGVKEPEKLLSDLFNTSANKDKVNINLLNNENTFILDSFNCL